MKTIRFAVILVAASGLTLTAEEDTTFTKWMKDVGKASAALNKMETKTGLEAVEQAEKISGVYEMLIGYWRQRNAKDAVQASVTGKAAALEIAAAAHAGAADKVQSALAALMGTCKSCHAAYREKADDGRYRIKQPQP